MKKLLILTVALIVAEIALLCGLAGCVSPPTAFEREFFDVQTNRVPRLVLVTNEVPSEIPGQPPTTVSELVTDYVAEVVWTANTNAARVAETAGHTSGLFGPWGELVSALVAGGFGLWAWLRSQRAAKTAGVLAQVIETGRQILQTTPQGRAADAEWKSWMVRHQAEQGVILDVIKLLQGVVDEQSAKAVAGELVRFMEQRKP